MASRSAYGPNPHAGINANADHGWGGYQWPGGVPSSLLATATYRGSKSTASCLCRRELVELFELLWEIADKKHGYPIYGSPNPSGEPTWGPWGYENRPIGGTSTPSNHSKGKAFDANAPRNPQSYTFQSDMPPAMVADFEACGFYWGGRYEGVKYDAMHFEYAFSPGDVAGHIARARAILGRAPAKPNPEPTPAKPGPSNPIELETDMGMVALRDTETGIDYLVGAPFVFVMVESEAAYNRYYDAGMVDKPHGQGLACKSYEVNWYRDKILAWRRAAGLPGAENVEAVIPKA